jgi:hypothetical protein
MHLFPCAIIVRQTLTTAHTHSAHTHHHREPRKRAKVPQEQLGAALGAHGGDGLGRGTDEDDTLFLAPPGKALVL